MMRRWFVGVAMSLIVAGVGVAMLYAVLNHFYGTRTAVTSTQAITIEDSGGLVVINNVSYKVEGAERIAGKENYYWLLISSTYGTEIPPTTVPVDTRRFPPLYRLIVPAEAYERAQTTGNPVMFSNVVTTETKPVNALPIAASIGIVIGVTVLAVWVGYRQMWGEATSTLLEHGLHDMTVRDIEIVGHIIKRGKFTIPELMKQSKASKITVWRTVQKLAEKGLVRSTEETRLAANGLGGRGKPSRVYEYVGPREAEPEI